jgi:hypothetical protein
MASISSENALPITQPIREYPFLCYPSREKEPLGRKKGHFLRDFLNTYLPAHDNNVKIFMMTDRMGVG